MEKIYIFGAGSNGRNAAELYGKENIIAFVDNSENLKNSKIDDIKIISPDTLKESYNGEIVIISSVYFAEDIHKQLNKMGIDRVYRSAFIEKNMKELGDYVDYLQLETRIWVAVNSQDAYALRICDVIRVQYPQMEIRICNDYGEADTEDDKGLIITSEKKDEVSGKNVVNLLDINIDKGEYNYLERYKDIHKGKRCFIIGNGPSLRPEDLDVIMNNGDISMGSNGICRIYDNTCWRPDYYFYVDYRAYERNHYISDESVFFLSDQFAKPGEGINIYHHLLETQASGCPIFSKDIVCGVSGGRSVTYVMLQFARYMGFSKVYLLGLDMNFSNGQTHFTKDYADEKLDSHIRESTIHRAEIIKNYEQLNSMESELDFKVYNATRGGALEAFERVDFDTLFI